MKLFAAGLSHKTAPVELRERLAVKQSEIADLAFVLKCFGHLDEIVLLSTCNRVEIYGTTRHATGHIKSLLQLLCAEPGALDPHIYVYEGAAAVRHLLRVTAGLDAHRHRTRHRFNQKHSSGIDWKDRSVAAIDHGTRRRRDGGELRSTSIKKRRAIDLHFESFV